MHLRRTYCIAVGVVRVLPVASGWREAREPRIALAGRAEWQLSQSNGGASIIGCIGKESAARYRGVLRYRDQARALIARRGPPLPPFHPPLGNRAGGVIENPTSSFSRCRRP